MVNMHVYNWGMKSQLVLEFHFNGQTWDNRQLVDPAVGDTIKVKNVLAIISVCDTGQNLHTQVLMNFNRLFQ